MPRILTRKIKGTPAYDPASFTPPGVSVRDNMMLARVHAPGGSPSAFTYQWFYSMVRNKGPWDYKNQSGVQYANFGNFNYGAAGTAAGIAESVLLRAAGWAQLQAGTSSPEFNKWYASAPYGDDPQDQYWIKAGIAYAKNAGY